MIHTPNEHLPGNVPEQSHSSVKLEEGAQRPYARDFCVPQLISRRAATAPEALALIGDGQAMTYQELTCRANQLAHYLKTVGVEPDMLVGVCLPRSLDLGVSLLGILQAGGAYVPLDPAYPSERKQFMLEDAATSVVITCEAFLGELPAQGRTIICLDRDANLWRAQPEDEPEVTIAVSNRAYVIYTSGSTGRPKGVQVSHGNLLNLVYWHQRAYGVVASDRATQVTSPAFDATGWELWPYLAAGASVYLPEDEIKVSPPLLRDWLLTNAITLTFLPTALAESMLSLEWPTNAALRYLLTGADALQHYPPPGLPFRLVNNYGPTETTVVATSGIVMPEEHPTSLPSIGRPIDNTQIYLLDEEMHEVPIGSPGELYISGESVALGYLGRPELTQERFIPDPFSARPGAKMYRTGDLASYLPDGQLSFLGRVDYQIKIRGYRIEPNEIVAILDRHPAVQSSAVIARNNRAGEKQLVAYVVLNAAQDVTVKDLQAILREHLPDYMIPVIYVVMESLPSTANGKVDRAALPEPDEENMLQDKTGVSPATPTEERLERIVAGLLELEQISVEDNFFLLGGHSLLGTQVIARVSAIFGVNLTLRSLFDSPTVRLLAMKVEELLLEKLASMSEEEAQHLLKLL